MEILDIKHKGLKEFYTKGRTAKLNAEHLRRITMIFDILEAAQNINDVISVKNLRCHEMQGPPIRGHHAVDVSGAWRITFLVNKDNELELLDYQQYH